MWGPSVRKPNEQIVKENKEEEAKLRRAYLALYQSEFGKIILKDLARMCGANISSVCFGGDYPFNTNQTFYACGKRDAWLYIDRLITEAKNGLD